MSGLIKSLDFLVYPRAQAIAEQFELNPSEIFPHCTEFNAQLNEAGGKLEVSDASGSTVWLYERMVASAAVVGYELSERLSVQFPAPEKQSRYNGKLSKYIPLKTRSVEGVRKEIMNALESQDWTARRVANDLQYRIMGALFEDNLQHINHHIHEGRMVFYAQDKVPAWPNSMVDQVRNANLI